MAACSCGVFRFLSELTNCLGDKEWGLCHWRIFLMCFIISFEKEQKSRNEKEPIQQNPASSVEDQQLTTAGFSTTFDISNCKTSRHVSHVEETSGVFRKLET